MKIAVQKPSFAARRYMYNVQLDHREGRIRDDQSFGFLFAFRLISKPSIAGYDARGCKNLPKVRGDRWE